MVHCFIAGTKVLEEYLEHHSGAIFSIAPKAFSCHASYMTETLRAIPQSKMVFETDGPYQSPLNTWEYGIPPHVVVVAADVCGTLHWPEPLLLRTATETLERFFH